MTSKAFAASSDRIKAARKALADLRTAIDGPHPADSGLDSFTLAHVSAVLDEVEPTLRALITPPAVRESEDAMVRRILSTYQVLDEDLPLMQTVAHESIQAGIQAAHASWGQTIEKEENR